MINAFIKWIADGIKNFREVNRVMKAETEARLSGRELEPEEIASIISGKAYDFNASNPTGTPVDWEMTKVTDFAEMFKNCKPLSEEDLRELVKDVYEEYAPSEKTLAEKEQTVKEFENLLKTKINIHGS